MVLVEHNIAFVEMLVVDIVLASRMVGCKRVVAQMDYIVEVLTHLLLGFLLQKRWWIALGWWILAYICWLYSFLRKKRHGNRCQIIRYGWWLL